MTTYTIYANASDDTIISSNATYSTARAGSGSLSLNGASNTTTQCGQNLSAGTYLCYEFFCGFNTSAVPTGSDSNVALTVTSLISNANKTIEARQRDFVPPVATGGFVAGASLGSLPLVGTASLNISDFDTAKTMSGGGGVTALDRGPNVGFVVYAADQRNNVAPSGAEHAVLYAADNSGTTLDPKLVFDSTKSSAGIIATTTYASSNTNSTSWNNIFTGLAWDADETMRILLVASDGAPTLSTASTGWSKVDQQSNSTVVTGAIFVATANTATAFSLTSSASEAYTAILIRCYGYTQYAYALANGSSTNSNPPQVTPGATRDHLYLSYRAGDSTVVATAAPSGYSGFQTQASAGTNGASSNSAFRFANGGNEDPGTFTSATEQWVAATLALWAGTSTQDLAPSLLGSSTGFFAPTISPSAVSLTAPLLSNAETFFAPAVSQVTSLTPTLLENTQTFFSPSIAPGTVSLAPGLLDQGQTFFGAALAVGAVDLAAPLIASSTTFFAPALTSSYNLTASLLASTTAFFAPNVVPGAVTLAPGLVDDGDTFFPAQVGLGAVTLVAPVVLSSTAFFAHQVSPGPVGLVPPSIASATIVFTPAVAPGAVALAPAMLPSATEFFRPDVEAGAVQIAPPLIPSGTEIFTPAIAAAAGGRRFARPYIIG